MKQVDHIISEREVLQYLQDKNAETEENERCPFLMGIFSSFQDKDNLYFELEYIQGCTLLSQIRQYNAAIKENWYYYSAEVLLSLQFLHSHNIIYRDLKPENMVISMLDRGHIKLVDFGFAKQLKSLCQRTHTNCGTPAYIAPEILRGHNGHGHEVDIWSLGVLLYNLVTGKMPFNAKTRAKIDQFVIEKDPSYKDKAWKQCSPDVLDLPQNLLKKNPSERLSIDEILNHSWL